jgi:lipid-binding SYLF domain-containing protein
MKLYPFLVVPVAASLVVAANYPAMAENDAVTTVESATQVFKEIMNDPKTRIPPEVLRSSQGIAIIPNVIQAGFFFGGRRGTGIVVVREENGRWSNPAFLNLTGGSFGLQFGAKSSDIVLVFKDRNSIADVLKGGSFKLGGSASATAGPVGASALDPTDAQRKAGIYSYARSEGLFAGVALEGAEFGFNNDKNQSLYGRQNITVQQIFSNQQIQPPSVVTNLKQVLNQFISVISQ